MKTVSSDPCINCLVENQDGGCRLDNYPCTARLKYNGQTVQLAADQQEMVDERHKVADEILGKLNARDVGGFSPEWGMSDKDYVILKAKYGGH